MGRRILVRARCCLHGLARRSTVEGPSSDMSICRTALLDGLVTACILALAALAGYVLGRRHR
jgi:hypothetical protein